MAYGFNPDRRFGLSDEEEDEILRSARAGVLSDARAPAPISLNGPTASQMPDVSRGVMEDIRAVDARAAANHALGLADDDNVPVIDLGDDAEIVIPRARDSEFGLADDEEPRNLFDVQSRAVAARPASSASLSSPSAIGRSAPVTPSTGRFSTPLDPRAARRMAPLPEPTGRPMMGSPITTVAAPMGLADDDSDPPGMTVTRADGTSYIVGPNGEQLPVNTPAMAPESDDEEIGADIDADADLEVSEPLDPRRRAKLFQPASQSTTQEDADIQRGMVLDARRNRARRIIAGVSGGLGLLGALTGNEGMAQFGQVVSGGANAINVNAADAARERQQQRIAREQAGIDRQNADIMATREMDRQDRGDALRESAAASDAAVNAERVRSLQAEQAESAFEQQALAGNAEGMRAAIRARAAAVQHGPTRAAWEERFANGGPLDSMTDLASLRTILAEVGDTDVRRGGQGAGGSGGGSRSETVWDPNANDGQGGYVQSRRQVRSAQPASPGQPEIAAAPTGTPPRRPAQPRPAVPQPQPGPAPAPGSTDIAPPSGPVDESTEVAWAERVMRSANWSDRDRREGVIRRLRTGQGNAAHDAALAEVTALAGRVERMREAGMPSEAVDIEPAEWDRMNTRAASVLTPLAINFHRADSFSRDLAGWVRNRPVALRAALASLQDPDSQSNFSPDVWAQGQDIVTRIRAYTNPILSERSGAAVTRSEFRRLMEEFGTGSWAGDLTVAQRAIDNQLTDWEERIVQASGDFNPIFVRDWGRRHGFGGDQ
jgi:hypothetical protein